MLRGAGRVPAARRGGARRRRGHAVSADGSGLAEVSSLPRGEGKDEADGAPTAEGGEGRAARDSRRGYNTVALCFGGFLLRKGYFLGVQVCPGAFVGSCTPSISRSSKKSSKLLSARAGGAAALPSPPLLLPPALCANLKHVPDMG